MNTATKIMLIRHAEKPADSGPPLGVSIMGEPDPESLIPEGWQRGGALAPFFCPSDGEFADPGLARPQSLFASGIGHHSHSLRPQQTITPTSQKLGIAINTTFLKADGVAMINDAMAATGVVLICWEHQDIPAIANQILGNATTVPQKWPGDRFDVVWVFDLNPLTRSYSFNQIPQLLLAGDVPTPIV